MGRFDISIEGEANLNEAIAGVIRSALDDETLLCALKTQLSDMRARFERIDARHKQKRDIAKQTMIETDIETIADADVTVSLRNSAPSIEIIDEDLLPEWLWVPQPSKLDKKSLLYSLKAGTIVTGAMLTQQPKTISVRTK